MTLSRRSFSLAAAAGLGALAVPRAGRAAQDRRHLLIVYARGAWDVTWCFDPKAPPKVDAPTGEVTTFGELRALTSRERPSIRAFFDAHHGRAAIVNGIWVGSIAHTSARVRILTGTRSNRSPDVAAVFASEVARSRPELALPYVDLGGGAFAGPFASILGRVGSSNQLVTLLDRKKAFKTGPGKPDRALAGNLAPEERDALAAFVARRADEARRAAAPADHPRLDGFRGGLDRAELLRKDANLRAMTVGNTTSLAQQGELAVAMFKGGLSAAAFLDSRLDWDTHDTIADQGASFEQLFAELIQIGRKLEEAGLLQSTTVAVLSEFTRTPKLNNQPEPGKDHWPLASALLFGGGVRPGTYGATDDGLNPVPVRMDDGTPSDRGQLLKFDSFAAGIIRHLGVSPGAYIPSVEPLRGPFV